MIASGSSSDAQVQCTREEECCDLIHIYRKGFKADGVYLDCQNIVVTAYLRASIVQMMRRKNDTFRRGNLAYKLWRAKHFD